MKTIAEIAKEIGVTKQAVHQRIKRKPLSTLMSTFTQTVDGVIHVSVDGENAIKSAFSRKEASTMPSTLTQTFTPPVDGIVDSVDGIKADYINSLKEQISFLKDQNKTISQELEKERTQRQNELEKEREHSRQ